MKKGKGTEKTVPTTSGEKVELSSLNTLQFFSYQDGIYSKWKATPAGVKALSQRGDELITLSPDTIVTVVEPSPKLEEEPGEAEASTEPGEAEAAAGPEKGEAGPEEGEAKASPKE